MSLFSTTSPKYRAPDVDLNDSGSAHAQLVRLVGKDKRVLEVGPAWGNVTKALKSIGCQVTCIEQSHDMAAIAQQHCTRMILGDIENLDLLGTFEAKSFQVITFGDVLEHLKDPVVVLRKVTPLLADDGYVVASIPNVAHQSVVYALLLGEFPYSDEGLLDRTHLRFFTHSTLQIMFQDAGFRLTEIVRITNDSFYVSRKPEYRNTFDRLKQKVLKAVLKAACHSDNLTYQFVVRAIPVKC